MQFATIPIIVVICGIFLSVVKLFTKGNDREEEIVATLVPLFGALLALLLYFIHSEYTLEFADPLVAVMIGFVSGQSALETKSTIDYIKSKKELKEMITEEIDIDEVKTDIVNEIVETNDVKEIIKEEIDIQEVKNDIVNEIIETNDVKEIIKEVLEETN